MLSLGLLFLAIALFFPQGPSPTQKLGHVDMSTPEAKAARRAKFEGVYDKIRDELIEHFAAQKMPTEAVEWYRNVSHYIASIFPS